jgi:putative hemolysin
LFLASDFPARHVSFWDHPYARVVYKPTQKIQANSHQTDRYGSTQPHHRPERTMKEVRRARRRWSTPVSSTAAGRSTGALGFAAPPTSVEVPAPWLAALPPILAAPPPALDGGLAVAASRRRSTGACSRPRRRYTEDITEGSSLAAPATRLCSSDGGPLQLRRRSFAAPVARQRHAFAAPSTRLWNSSDTPLQHRRRSFAPPAEVFCSSGGAPLQHLHL